uniref:Uncharacterized protein n=1 Tax=Salmo trutta TaxID=8032 RepID=A0A673X265_SALTR
RMKFIKLDQSATVDDLTDAYIKAFGKDSPIPLVQMFLMRHPWYISSADLAKKLSNKYPFRQMTYYYSLKKKCMCQMYWISEFPQIRGLKEQLAQQGEEHQNTLINIDSSSHSDSLAYHLNDTV